MIKFFKKNKKGFSLAELIVVIAILGILAAIVVPRIAVQSDAARTAADNATLRIVRGAIAMYHATNGRFPVAGNSPYTNTAYTALSTHLDDFMDLGPAGTMPLAQQTARVFRYDRNTGFVTLDTQ